ncbi:MAG TPA: glycosyltransferase, partial [Thermoanaerobaculia bacterium]|nr:glycosyltransferase [Thermoanaerobaculia bacterium]
LPKVSIHVPAHNEPPEMVIETLDALARLDYPHFEVLVIDNNTADESLWRPVEEHCRRLGPRFRFFHLLPWPGYKSGALNFALSQTAADAEIIGIVDADYIVEPGWLADLVGYFADPACAFVQTPQDYRDAPSRGRFARAMYLSYLYFFRISMASRNQRNGIIFAGTMGLIRRRALEEADGWDEWCITEDAELSLRLLEKGYRGIYVDQTYGRGLMPLDYAGLKKQRFRWAFGGMQILRMHAALLFHPWRGRLSPAQRFSYVSGGLQWLNDPLTLAFTVLLLFGSSALLIGGSFYVQPIVGAVVLVPPLFIFFAVARFLWAFRVRTGCRLREAIDALVILMGLTWVVTLACLRGLTSRQGVFLRTPKQEGGRQTLIEAGRIAGWETALGCAALLLMGALLLDRPVDFLTARGIIVVLLGWQALTYLSGSRSSLWSYLEGAGGWPGLRRKVSEDAGYALGTLVRERRMAGLVLLMAALGGGIYYLAISRAPVEERMARVDPLRQYLPAETVMRPTVEQRVASRLMLEAEAVRSGDPVRALMLWHPEGTIIDRNYTPADPGDDRIWSGREELLERYRREIAQRKYHRLRHLNLDVDVRGDVAVVTNDLDALLETPGRRIVYRVALPKSDRWTFRRIGGEWKIVSLEVNRASPASGRVRPLSTAESGGSVR